MRREAKRMTLLYASDSASGQIFVYAYPAGKLEGVLTNVLGGTGECVDKAGNIWIPDGSRNELLKFAHGGTDPIKILQDRNQTPYGCSIDPTTGDLAAFSQSGAQIYRRANGLPNSYSDPAMYYTYFGGYDNQGNLFIDGHTQPGYFQFAELPKGSQTFVNFSLTGAIPGGVEWDGKYITFGDQFYGTVSEVAVYGSNAKVVSQTTIAGAYDPVYQYAFSNFAKGGGLAQRFVGLDFEGTGGTVGTWNYPAGGTPRKLFPGDFYPTGVAISPAR
jgi:hypothetical protein